MQDNVPGFRHKDLSTTKDSIGFNDRFAGLHLCATQIQLEATEDRSEAPAAEFLSLQARLSAAKDVVEVELAIEVGPGSSLEDKRTFAPQGIPQQHGAYGDDEHRP